MSAKAKGKAKESKLILAIRHLFIRITARYKLWLREKSEASIQFENENERRLYEFVIKLIKNPKSDAFKSDNEHIEYNIQKDDFRVSFNDKFLNITAPNRSENILLYSKAYDYLIDLYLDKIHAKKIKFDKETQAAKNKILDDMFNSSGFKFDESIDQ